MNTIMYQRSRRTVAVFIFVFLIVIQSNFCVGKEMNSAKDLWGDDERALICSFVSLSSYGEDFSVFVREKMKERGWSIKKFEGNTKTASSEFYFFEQTDPVSKKPVRIVAITGTKNLKDVALDLRFHRVPFGLLPKDMDEKRGRDTTLPLVHNGFQDYTEAAFFTHGLAEYQGRTFGDYLSSELAASRDKRLYITGHSLGGAVASLLAARLADMGAAPEQISVITFGAPAVGNAAFAKAYEKKFHLERIIIKNDPIKSVLQSVTGGGYAQFGVKTEWEESAGLKRFPHEMVVYLDTAIRHYYDALEKNPLQDNSPQSGNYKHKEHIYVMPMGVKVDNSLSEDEKYVRPIIKDMVDDIFPKPVFGDVKNMREATAKAKAVGSSHLLELNFEGALLKKEKNMQRITLSGILYDLKGNPLSFQELSTTTDKITPLEGVMYLSEKILQDITKK